MAVLLPEKMVASTLSMMLTKLVLQFFGIPSRIGSKYCQKLLMAWTGALLETYPQYVPGDSLATHAASAPA